MNTTIVHANSSSNSSSPSESSSCSSSDSDKYGKLVYLIDTKAHVSIIKISALEKNILINKTEIIHLNGIANEKRISLGSVVYKIYVRKIALKTFFTYHLHTETPKHRPETLVRQT